MRASLHPQLGRIVAVVLQAESDLLSDPMNDYAGFTPDPTPRLEEIVREEGFANLRHFWAAVERRTSQRWAYFRRGVAQ